jgi:hypothetical protein
VISAKTLQCFLLSSLVDLVQTASIHTAAGSERHIAGYVKDIRARACTPMFLDVNWIPTANIARGEHFVSHWRRACPFLVFFQSSHFCNQSCRHAILAAILATILATILALKDLHSSPADHLSRSLV